MTKLFKMTFDEIAALKAGDRVAIKCMLSGRVNTYKMGEDAVLTPPDPRYTKEGLMAMGFPEEAAERGWQRMYCAKVMIWPLGFEKKVYSVEEGFSKWVFRPE
jgi:hypothetical protein